MRPLTATLTCALAIGVGAPSYADMFRPSPADQVKLGRQAAADLRKKEKVVSDRDARVQTLRDIGRKLLSTIPTAEMRSKPWEFSFDVLENKQINAFALPGGPVFFCTGILAKISTEDQLAGVLAHELTHVRKEHWASAYADSQKRSLGISVVLALLRAGRTAVDVASISNALLFDLPFSRKHESEADSVGYDMMVKAGYNPQGMADVFRMLSQNSGSTPQFLSTHPDSKARVKAMEERIAREGRSYAAQRPVRYVRG